jgi:hypothetical protein
MNEFVELYNKFQGILSKMSDVFIKTGLMSSISVPRENVIGKYGINLIPKIQTIILGICSGLENIY